MLGNITDDKLRLKILLLYLIKKRRTDLVFSHFFFYFFKTNLDAPSLFFRTPTFFSKTFLDLGLEEGDEFLEDEEVEEAPLANLGSRRAFCRNLLYFFRELPNLALEGGCEVEEVELMRRLSHARSKQLNLQVRLMHEYKADPLAILHEWLSDFFDEILGSSLEQYDFLEPKNLEPFFKQGFPRGGYVEELLEEAQVEPKDYELTMLNEVDDFSEFDDATLSILGDPGLEVDEGGCEYYNFFFLKTREAQRATPKLGGLLFFDPSFFFCEGGGLSTEVGLLTEVPEPCGLAGDLQAEWLDDLDQPESFDIAIFEDLEEGHIEALFFGLDGGLSLGRNQALLEDYFVEELCEDSDEEEEEGLVDEGAEALVDDPVEALLLEGAWTGTLAEESASSEDDEPEPSFQKNFLPFFFVLKRLKSFFFFRDVFSFFFFFLPFELVSFIYASLEDGLESMEPSSNFFFETLRGSKSSRALNKTPLALAEVLQSYIYEPDIRGKSRGFSFFLFLSRFFNHKLKEDFCLSVVSARELKRGFGLFVLKYGASIKPFFENMLFPFNTPEFIEIFFLCLEVKDLTALATYVKTLFEKIQIKFHKVFLKKFDLFLTFFFSKLSRKFGVKGFLMDVRGKVSAVGNSKKRHVCIKQGYLSKTKKELRFFFLKNQINTTTGVLGASYLLSF